MNPQPTTSNRTHPPEHSFWQRFVAGILVTAALPALAIAVSAPGMAVSFAVGLLTAGLVIRLRRHRRGTRREHRTPLPREAIPDDGGR